MWSSELGWRMSPAGRRRHSRDRCSSLLGWVGADEQQCGTLAAEVGYRTWLLFGRERREHRDEARHNKGIAQGR